MFFEEFLWQTPSLKCFIYSFLKVYFSFTRYMSFCLVGQDASTKLGYVVLALLAAQLPLFFVEHLQLDTDIRTNTLLIISLIEVGILDVSAAHYLLITLLTIVIRSLLDCLTVIIGFLVRAAAEKPYLYIPALYRPSYYLLISRSFLSALHDSFHISRPLLGLFFHCPFLFAALGLFLYLFILVGASSLVLSLDPHRGHFVEAILLRPRYFPLLHRDPVPFSSAPSLSWVPVAMTDDQSRCEQTFPSHHPHFRESQSPNHRIA